MEDIIVTTGNEIPGKQIQQILGVVKGNSVRARNLGRDIGAGLRNLVGGEVKTYTEMTKNARDEAYNRMVNEALDLGADAVVNIRFTTCYLRSFVLHYHKITFKTIVKSKVK